MVINPSGLKYLPVENEIKLSLTFLTELFQNAEILLLFLHNVCMLLLTKGDNCIRNLFHKKWKTFTLCERIYQNTKNHFIDKRNSCQLPRGFACHLPPPQLLQVRIKHLLLFNLPFFDGKQQKEKEQLSTKCHDSPSNKFYGEDETWEPNDCTVCVCRNGTPECLATVCRHPDCKEPIYIKGQCCPVCPLVYPNTSYQKEADLIKAFAENKLDTVLVSINHGGKQDVCHDIRTGKNYLVGQSWQLDQCTTCYCGKSGKAACALQMCERDPKCKDLLIDNNECCPKCKDENVVKSTSKCYDTITKKYYGEAELWQRNKCTSCYCGNDRKPVCTHTVCPPVFCELPMDIEGRCCPVCPANIQQGCMFDAQRFLHGDSKLLMDKCTLCVYKRRAEVIIYS
ncbi:Cysteine-rich motor neuron 1 protein [Acropora cervicornis]|uniref:Cysteine-rich motor neuron 1 protein n=1 Tax=Acropora cervicornis TaxID=6130 RepID=A0AAD9QP73_ACRCE|nr:Cysteine-rich motor neuron 1 protein [Acropora cervicornis]